MKKSAKTGRAIRPPRSPVLPIRVPQPIYDELKKAAKTAGMTLSEYVARLIARGQEWQEAIGEARNLLQQAKAEAKRIVSSAAIPEFRRYNWRRNPKTGLWEPPEVHGLPPNGFIADEPETAAANLAGAGSLAADATVLDPRITAEIKRAVIAALDERNAA